MTVYMSCVNDVHCGCRQCSECVKAADDSDNDTSDPNSSQPRRLRHKTLIREPVKYASTYPQPLRMVMTACDSVQLFAVLCEVPAHEKLE